MAKFIRKIGQVLEESISSDIRTKLSKAFIKVAIPSLLLVGVAAGTASIFPKVYPKRIFVIFIFAFSAILAYFVNKRYDSVRASKVLLTVSTAALITAVLINGGVMAPAYMGLTCTLIFISWLFSARATLIFLASIIALGPIAFVLTKHGYLPATPVPTPFFYWICYATFWTAITASVLSGHKMLHRSLRELAEREYLLNSIFSSLDDVLITIDSDNEIVHCNKAAKDIIKDKNLTISSCLDNLRFEREDGSSGTLKEIITQANYNMQNSRLRLCDTPQTQWFLLSCTPIELHGKIAGAAILMRDITVLVQQENILSQNQKLDAVGQLASGIAHDFNNMLAGIMSASELLQLNLSPENTECLEYTSMITESAQRASELASNLLQFSQKKSADKNAIDIHSTISKTVAILEKTIDKRIRIHTSLNAGNSTVMADSSQLHSVFLNLGINASHAMTEGGKLLIKTENTNIEPTEPSNGSSVLPAGEYIQITVTDTGCGIAKDIITRIFEPFFSTKTKGTGLGLSSAYATIKQHNGHITASSEQGQGTSFSILLPVCQKAVGIDRQSEKNSLHGLGTILLVDDEKIVRKANEKMLIHHGYDIIAAEDGWQAIDIFKTHHQKIDLVVMDMIMPRVNGRDCFFALREIDPQISIILSTGYASREQIEELQQHGLDDIIYKPYTCQQLCTKISDLLPATELHDS